ncbi:MAG: thiamine pyrophosphate-binding protein, partial [Sphingomonadales bacterium]
MIEADEFLEPAFRQGFNFYTGVPCSFLTPLINRAIDAPRINYVGATSEGEAVAIAAGAWLAGRQAVVMGQNSGLGNMVNPLTSLSHPFRIPVLLIVTWRGRPGLGDEPQHEVMGRIIGDLLETLNIDHRPFPMSPDEVAPALDAARAAFKQSSLPFALIMEKG